MNYQEAVAYILEVPKFAKKTGRENLLSLLKRLGNPHLQTKAIHVAGTNGKGSTCAYMESILREGGYRTGMFLSPHLIKINERFRIQGEEIEDSVFLKYFLRVQSAVEEMTAEGMPHVSFFEWLFVMAALLFAESHLDYAIYETGLGGRLDATNTLEPEVCVITSIGLDHMEYLGNTITSIAGEKAGIIKPKVPVVYACSKEEAACVIEKKARENLSDFFPIDKRRFKIIQKSDKYIDFYSENRYYKDNVFGDGQALRIQTIASYQVENAALAVQAVKVLLPMIADQAILKGLSQMMFAGRMEQPEAGVYLDGAHNDAAILEWIQTVKEIRAEKVLLFAVASDKDYSDMIADLCSQLTFSHIIVTKLANERGTAPQVAAGLFREHTNVPVEVQECIQEALAAGRAYRGEHGVLLCVGSLYLVGSLKEIYRTIEIGGTV